MQLLFAFLFSALLGQIGPALGIPDVVGVLIPGILAREIDGMRLEDVTKSGGDSRIVIGRMRQIGGDAR